MFQSLNKIDLPDDIIREIGTYNMEDKEEYKKKFDKVISYFNYVNDLTKNVSTTYIKKGDRKGMTYKEIHKNNSSIERNKRFIKCVKKKIDDELYIELLNLLKEEKTLSNKGIEGTLYEYVCEQLVLTFPFFVEQEFMNCFIELLKEYNISLYVSYKYSELLEEIRYKQQLEVFDYYIPRDEEEIKIKEEKKEEIKEENNGKVLCPVCHIEISKNYFKRHEKTKKHKNKL